MQDGLHQYILNIVRMDLVEVIGLMDSSSDRHHFKDDYMFRTLFKNYRYINDMNTGLRLSYVGNKVLSKHFESFVYQFSDKPKNKSLIALDNNMNWPYYIGNRYVSFYSEEDAAWFRLNGQDLNQYAGYI